MKLVAVCALLASSAAAFTPPTMTFAVGKKAAPKTAGTKVVGKPVAKAAAPATKAAPKAAAPKAAAKPAPKPVAKAAPKAVAKPAPKPAPKPVAKVAPKPKPVVKKVAPPPKKVVKSSGTVASKAIPYEEAPALLDGSLVGDSGFDPCFLATRSDSMADYFNGLFNGVQLDGLSWYREAELMHGRICMVAALGFVAPGFGTISGSEWTGVGAFDFKNPLEAIGGVPSASLFQIFAFMSLLEFRRINIIQAAGSSYVAGTSQKWGQGEGFWNPLGLNYSPAEYKEKQLQELKNGRLAMIGFLGLVFQANASGESVVQQWSAAFHAPDFYAKAGYYFPEGI